MLSIVSILSASLLVSNPPLTSQDTSLWRYTTTEKIEFYRITPPGDVIVGTKDGIVVLDPETGEPRWTRTDILKPPGGIRTNDAINDVSFDKLFPFPAQQYNPIPFSPYALVRTNDGIVMIDLGTGESMWDSAGLPLEKVRGHFPVLQHDMVLVYGEGPETKRTFVGVDITTGAVRWRQDTLLRKSPSMPRAKSVRSFVGHQPPVVDSDTTFILNVSKDGPMRIDSRTGALLWRSDLDEDAPLLREGYAPMLYEDGVLFAPYKKKLVALSTSDGSVIWDRRRDFRSRVTQMELTPHGLVIRGRKPHDKEPNRPGSNFFIDLVDPENGTSIWDREFRDLNVNTPFFATDEAILITARNEFVALDYASGSAARLARFAFEGKDDPTMLEMSGGNLLISSNQNLLAISGDGAVQYHVFYEAPGRSLFENIAVMASAAAAGYSTQQIANLRDADLPDWVDGGTLRRFQNAEEWANYAYVYTKEPDAAGREGFSLVRIDKRYGEEVARVWLDERRPQYLIDEPSGMVFVKTDDNELVAFAFPAR